MTYRKKSHDNDTPGNMDEAFACCGSFIGQKFTAQIAINVLENPNSEKTHAGKRMLGILVPFREEIYRACNRPLPETKIA